MQAALFDEVVHAPAGGEVLEKKARYSWLDAQHGVEKKAAQALFGSEGVEVEQFGSGCSARWDMAGYMLAGLPLGVTATSLKVDDRVVQIRRYVEDGGRVFVDSGAFGAFMGKKELDFTRDVFPIYDALVRGCGRPSGLLMVMPDVVGDPVATARLQEQSIERIRSWMAAGVEVIFPLQGPGGDPMSEYRRVMELVGTDRFTVGIPSNAAAWSPTETIAFAAQAQPHRMHLLGLAREDAVTFIAESIREASPDTVLSCDACKLIAHLGVGRRITDRCKGRQEAALDWIANGAWNEEGGPEIPCLSAYLYGIQYEPGELSEEQAVALARGLGLDAAWQKAFGAGAAEGLQDVMARVDPNEEWLYEKLSAYVKEHLYGPMVLDLIRGPIRAWEVARVAANEDPDKLARGLMRGGRYLGAGGPNLGLEEEMRRGVVQKREQASA